MSTLLPQPSDGKNDSRENHQGVLKFDAERPELIPADLRSLSQFCTWRYEDKGVKAGEASKATKVPHRPTGVGLCDKTNPAHLGTLQECVEGLRASRATKAPLDGVGFSFLTGNGWAGLDFDKATSVEGVASAELRDLLAHLKGVACYVERSPSGTGVKAILQVDTEAVRRGLEVIRPSSPRESMKMACARPGLKEVQAFYGGGYFTLTGVHWEPEANPSWTGVAFEDATEAFLAVVRAAHALKFRNAKPKASKNHEPPLRLAVPLTDDEVLALAFKASNGATVRSVYEGSDASHGGDASAADLALANHLAFYCGPNGHAQVERIMRASPRNRDKFEREDYMASTLAKAYDGRTDYYDPSRNRTEPRPKGQAQADVFVDEFGLVDAFLKRHHGALVWSDTGRWYWMDDASGTFTHDKRETVMGEAIQVVRDALDSPLTDARTRGRLSKVAIASAVLRGARGVGVERGGLSVRHEELDADGWNMGTPAGVLDLKTGELRKGTMADLVTKRTRVAPADRADESTCPNWLAFLRSVLSDDHAMLTYLQRHAGYCLTGDLSEHAFLMVTGPGGTGKSTYLEVLSHVLGDYAVTMSAEVLMDEEGGHPTHVASLAGARMATASEFPEGKYLNEARLKRLTGNDLIRARFMRQDEFSFPMQAKIVAVTNHRPRLKETSDAIARRLQVVEFKNKPAVPDLGLRAKLEREAPGILRWALDGLADLLKNRAQGQGLNPPDAVTKATKAYIADEDSLSEWWDERYMFLKHAHERGENFVPSSTLLASWKEWAEANGVHLRVDTKKMAEFMHLKFGVGEPVRDKDPQTGQRVRGFYGVVPAPRMADADGCSD